MFPLRMKEFIKTSFSADGFSTNPQFRFLCLLCGTECRQPVTGLCSHCGGAIDSFYDYSKVKLYSDAHGVLETYRDLIPVTDFQTAIGFDVEPTPCLHSVDLGQSLGLKNLFLKDETANPTRSAKDRMSAVALAFLVEHGIREFSVASTGNSSTAFAEAVKNSLTPVQLHVFASPDFLHRLNYQNHSRIQTYVVDGDFVTAGLAAKEFARRMGIFPEPGFFNLARREGLKLAYLEAFSQMPVTPKLIFQAVSSGMGLLGAYKGALEFWALGRVDALPALVAVQQSSCSPMVSAFSENLGSIENRHKIHLPRGPAEAILRGDPTRSFPYINFIVRDSGGTMISVTEAEMKTARDRIFEFEGLTVCYASAAAVAAMIKLVGQHKISAQTPILVNLTGGLRPKLPHALQLNPFQFESVPLRQTANLG